MRILSVLRKVSVSGALNVAVISGFVCLSALPTKVHSGTAQMGDMGAFIEEHAMVLEPVPPGTTLEDLGAFIESLPGDAKPVIVMPKREKLSDGRFDELSASWKRGVVQVVQQNRCATHAAAFHGATIDPVLQKAQAIVESNCDATVVGSAGELGIFQVMPATCKSIGITGDYRTPAVSARCAEKYRTMFCAISLGKCTARLMILAHNRGIAGALHTVRAESTEYVRKVDCAARVLLGKQCA